MPGTWEDFELAARAIPGQQITVHAAPMLAGMREGEGGVVKNTILGVTRHKPATFMDYALRRREIRAAAHQIAAGASHASRRALPPGLASPGGAPARVSRPRATLPHCQEERR